MTWPTDAKLFESELGSDRQNLVRIVAQWLEKAIIVHALPKRESPDYDHTHHCHTWGTSFCLHVS